MKTLKEQIRDKEIGKLYLLTGNEPFLIRLNAERIKNALISEEDAIIRDQNGSGRDQNQFGNTSFSR